MKHTYGLIGHPLGHSFSKAFFTEKFQTEGIEAEYLNFDLPDIVAFATVIQHYPSLRGLNVTLPYKQQIMPFMDELSEEARSIGAVNVIKVTHDGNRTRLKGYNSDVIGFINSIRPLLRPHHQKALVLGTGGASRAIVYGLHRLGLETCYVSRSPREGMISYSDIDHHVIDQYPVIVNCSPCGMYPHVEECPLLPYESFGPNNVLYDLVYNPLETLFLRKGKAQGATVKNGLEMLHLQALASWDFWNSND
ncbi:MAG: shikimate dehydrogenase [Bacteroidaceae bacterium]|nr:shikimate dehydrogenase [Bacteroidaceae bacterium]